MEYPRYRRAILELSPEILIALCKMTEPTTVCVTEHALPADAVCVGADYDAARDVWRLGVESAEFAEVEHGQMLPLLPPPVWTRIEVATDLYDLQPPSVAVPELRS